eukprot:CAMPEP_0201725588 /NCGR_PEP_ID=MMETSP0593-20130828/8947_1 /ASSEMBLY_ACC=CAM_ASM_000672 /TAXON_ID=267983 /ORGANISM="Skeletonema japonicum, Strain CCMP2506" /LENGTH=337 /DNA_ID=CAMNT_0048217007 /DNA_START=114 /DNA_END=1127 /DNA_ORIENTATION=-
MPPIKIQTKKSAGAALTILALFASTSMEYCDAAVSPEVIAAAITAGVPLVDKLVGAFRDSDIYRRRDDRYIFFEGNYCSENLAGSFWPRESRGHQEIVNAKKVAFIENDEARSVLIQGPIRKGEVLFLWDSPDGGEDDDRARIEMRKELKLGEGYCVGTFEWTYHDSTVDVRYYKDNGLDGKVSLVANTWGKPVPAPAPAPRRISGSSSGTCGSGNRGNGICSDEKCCSKWGWCGSSSEHCSNRMLRGNSYNTTEEGLDRDRDRDLDLETKVHVLTLIDEPHENDDWMVNNTNTAIDGNIDDDEPAITEKESYFYVDDALAFELELQMAAMTMDHGS